MFMQNMSFVQNSNGVQIGRGEKAQLNFSLTKFDNDVLYEQRQ